MRSRRARSSGHPDEGRPLAAAQVRRRPALIGRIHPATKLDSFQKSGYRRRVTPDFETQLRSVSLRVTRPRMAVLAALRDHPHVDTDEVIALVRMDNPTVSHQTVYDVLRALTTAGLVRRIQPTGGPARYESRVGDNHHHIVCRSCGAIADVDCAVGRAPCLTASDDHGFVVDEAEVVYRGTCPDCKKSDAPSALHHVKGSR